MTERSSKKGSNVGLTFEEAFNKLEEAVNGLEAGGLTLTGATHLYEEGMRLARVCNEQLSATELRITRLQSSFGEQMRFLSAEAGNGTDNGFDGAAESEPEELSPDQTVEDPS